MTSFSIEKNPRNGEIYARQIAFCAAFILPMGKLLEVPSILSASAKGDILLPALLHFLAQSLVLLGVLYAASQSEKSLLERLSERFGGWIILPFILYGLYFLLASILPLLDLEKFVYAAFFDTAPTTFSFGAFFFLLAFVCTKGIKALGRFSDLCLFLFLLPFFALVGMGFFETNLSHLLPFFGTDWQGISSAAVKSTPQFADAALLLPLLVSRRYEKGDGVKIMSGYWIGAFFTLLFFAVFFGIFSTLSSREHYAFSKIAQYFPALDTVGRIDLIFVYLLSVVLLLYTCIPLLYSVDLTARLFSTSRKTLLSAAVSLSLFFVVLFFNRFYNLLYGLISGRLYPIFWIMGSLLPLLLLLLPKEERRA